MTTHSSASDAPTAERDDIVASLQRHRGFLLHTVDGITDEEARQRTTVSELTLGGLIKHVGQTEKQWADFIVNGPAEGPAIDWAQVDWSNPPPEVVAYASGHQMLPNETLAELIADLPGRGRRDRRLGPERRSRQRPPAAEGALVRAGHALDRAPQPCCTSSPRPASTPATLTSSGRPSTVRRPWADDAP